MRTYTVIALLNFTDVHDENVKYKKNKEFTVSEERFLELLSSETPVIRYLSHTIDDTELNALKNENSSLKAEIETLKKEKSNKSKE